MSVISSTPYWWQAAPPRDYHLEHWPDRVDVLIIGGGFTGFGAAIPLARAGLSVLVIEADQVGSGASTRNGGITSGNIRLSFNALKKRFGQEQAVAFYQEAHKARADLYAFIRDEKIVCDLQACGRFVGTMRENALDSMRRDADRLQDLLGVEAIVHNRNTMPDHIDSARYQGGVWRNDIAGIHPAKLLAGMADVAQKASVAISTGTRFLSVKRDMTHPATPIFEVKTSRGMLRAGHVISATNAYTDATQPWLRRRLVPVISEMIATEEIGENMVRSLMPSLSMYGESLQLGHYYRPSPDGKRILLGGRRMNPDPALARLRLKQGLTDIFPQLADVELTNHWFGFVAFPFDQLPKLGVHDGVIYPAGYCGSGTVWARWLGQKAAHMVLGDLDGTVFSGMPFRTMPFYSGDPWFLPLAMKFYALQDKIGATLK